MTDKRILITGAAGFIGKHLLKKMDDKNCIGLTHKTSLDFESSKAVSCDLTDRLETKRIISELKPDIVFHLAALTNPKRNEGNPEDARTLNVGITENIIHAIDPRSTHIVYLSTDKVFDGEETNPAETSNTNSLWHYGTLKLECEKIIEEKVEKHHIIRLPIVHSNGEANSNSFIDEALIDLKNGKQIKVYKNVKRCFVYVSELVDFLITLITDSNYGIYHAGSSLYSYYDRILMLCEQNGIVVDDKMLPVDGDTKPLVQSLNTSRLQQTYNFNFN